MAVARRTIRNSAKTGTVTRKAARKAVRAVKATYSGARTNATSSTSRKR